MQDEPLIKRAGKWVPKTFQELDERNEMLMDVDWFKKQIDLLDELRKKAIEMQLRAERRANLLLMDMKKKGYEPSEDK